MDSLKGLCFLMNINEYQNVTKQKHIHPQNFLIIRIYALFRLIFRECRCTGTMRWNLSLLKKGRVMFLWILISIWCTAEILL